MVFLRLFSTVLALKSYNEKVQLPCLQSFLIIASFLSVDFLSAFLANCSFFVNWFSVLVGFKIPVTTSFATAFMSGFSF